MGYCRGIPKPMIPIAGKPVLEHQMSMLRLHGVTDVYLSIGYLGHLIEEYFGDGSAFGVNISYLREESPLGTAGGMKKLMGIISEDFYVVYGDILFDVKLDDYLSFHRNKNSAATLIVHPNDHPFDSDLVEMDDNCQISGFHLKDEKPPYHSNIVNAAFYLVSPRIFSYIPTDAPSDFVKDVFPAMLGGGERLYGYRTAEYLKDMGTYHRFDRVSADLESGRIHAKSKYVKRAAVFIDRDGTLIHDVELLCRVEDARLFPFATESIKSLNRHGILAIMATNQPVVARNLCDEERVRLIHRKIETELGHARAFLDDIFYCPHHPDKGYPEENPLYKIECRCRKPDIGMLEDAAERYNIDLAASWFVGDTTGDIQTGMNAGMKTILVRTGKGGADGKFEVSPDYVCDTLKDAVKVIISHSR